MNEHRACFQFEGISMCLITDDKDITEWCKHYFRCFFTNSSKSNADVTLYVLKDIGRIEIESNMQYAIYENYKIFYSTGFKILICEYSEKEGIEKVAMRILREALLGKLYEAGYLFFHGAAVELFGCGVGIIGNKFSGKTSTCLNLLRYGAKFIANDKMMAKKEEGIIKAVGLPIAIGIRDGSINTFEELSQYRDEMSGERLYLTPSQLVETFSTEIVSKANIKLILNPCYDANRERLYWRELDEGDKRELLASQTLKSVFNTKRYLSNENMDRELNNDLIEEMMNIRIVEIRQNERLNAETFKLIRDLINQTMK